MIARFFYTLLLSLIFPILFFLLIRKKKGKPYVGKRWVEYFGFVANRNDRPIWIHCASVGEVLTAIPLVKALKVDNPEQSILFTTMTTTGAERVDNSNLNVAHCYLPVDFKWCIKLFLKRVKPQKLLLVEMELWPNLVHEVAKVCPVFIVNGRLSDNTALKYQRISFLTRDLFQKVTKIWAITKVDCQNFVRIGMPFERIEVSGSIKWDIELSEKNRINGSLLKKQLGERFIWIASSTHEGEEEQILEAHQGLLKAIPDALLIIVPRHPERFDKVTLMAKDLGYRVVERTNAEHYNTQTQVYIANTMGEMLTLLVAADVCFMGGSLIGDKVGGHNFIEPALLGKPCLTGQSYYNFIEIADVLIEAGGLKVIDDAQELAQTLLVFAKERSLIESLGNKSKQCIEKNKGAIAHIVNQLK